MPSCASGDCRPASTRCGSQARNSPHGSELIGTWSLTGFEITFEDDRPSIQAMGEGARGLLVYARTVMCSLCSAGTEPPSASADSRQPTPTDAAKARIRQLHELRRALSPRG